MSEPTHAYQRKDSTEAWYIHAVGSFDYCQGWKDALTPQHGLGRVVALYEWEIGNAHAFWRTQGEAGFWNPCEVYDCPGYKQKDASVCPQKTLSEVRLRVLREVHRQPPFALCPRCMAMIRTEPPVCRCAVEVK
jgi:hypothetical protein